VRAVPTLRPEMQRFHRGLLALATLAWVVAALPTGARSEEEGSWPMVGLDARHSGAAEGPAPPYSRAWTVRLGDQGPLKGPAVSDGAVVLVGAGSVVALEAASGEVRWEVDREEGPAGPPAIAGDLVLYSSGQDDDATLVARRIDGGREEWTLSTDGAIPGGIAVEGDRAYAATRTGQVLAVDIRTGEVEWRFQSPGNLGTTPAVAEALVLVSAQGDGPGPSTLHAIDKDTGKEAWRFALPGPARAFGTSPSAGGGLALAGLSDGQIHAFDLGTGAERWAERSLPDVGTGPFDPAAVPAVPDAAAIGDAAGLYFPGLARAVRLDPRSGRTRWTYQLSDLLLRSSPSLSGPYVLFGDASGLAAAIDARSGLLVWKQDLGPGPIGPAAVTPGRLFWSTGAEQGTVVALDHDPGGTLLGEESPSVFDPIRAGLNYLGAAVAVGALLFLLFRGPETLRRRSREAE
jgi:eukaryotic-like serine/threonine-protein kinase